jgi:hypothetical protein
MDDTTAFPILPVREESRDPTIRHATSASSEIVNRLPESVINVNRK